MSLHLYNTLTRELERFKPLRQEEVKVYSCGPTPYNYAHIGNLRAYLFEDFIIRTLRFLGYRVRTVMNITDIDDKTIRDSQKSGKTLSEFTEFYANEFLADIEKLHIHRADTIAPISGLIPDMQKLIQGLLDKGYAYLAEDGSIYYRVEKFKKYGELAHLDMSGMISSVRINNDEYEKDQVADFALWKAYDEAADGPNWWEIEIEVKSEKGKVKNSSEMGVLGNSPLSKGDVTEGQGDLVSEKIPPTPFIKGESEIGVGKIKIKGRPGWHIECSACNYRFFGEQIDIHMGGIDNLFPHHQNEVAQTEAFTGKQFSKYWMHGGHLLVDNKKMAKSAGNFYTLRDIVERYSHSGKTSQMRSNLDEVGVPQGAVSGNTANEETQHGIQSASISEVLVYRGFRLMALQNQYRENFNFTFERLDAAINTIKGLDEMMKRLGRYLQNLIEKGGADEGGGGLAVSENSENQSSVSPTASQSFHGGAPERNARGRLKFHHISPEFRENQQYFMQEFVEKLENDFDTVSAMTVVFAFQSYINSAIDDALFSREEAKSLIDLMKSWDEVIAILDFSFLESNEQVPQEIEVLAIARAEAKLQKNWAEADKLRDELTSLGWRMIDEAGGRWRVEKI